MNILIVEDELMQSAMYRTRLKQVGYTVTIADNASEALALDWREFDAVLSDVMMPGLSGDKMVRLAMATYGDAMPPVIIFSAVANSMLERIEYDMPQNGHVTYWQKNGTLAELLETLERTVENACHCTKVEH